MIIPIGTDEYIRRMPWAIICIAALCVGVHVYALFGPPEEDRALMGLLGQRQAMEQQLYAQYMSGLRSTDETSIVGPGGGSFAEELEETMSSPPPAGMSPQAFLAAYRRGEVVSSKNPQYRQLMRLDARIAAMMKSHRVLGFAYYSSDPVSKGLFTSAFLHAGWLHLGFNLLFLCMLGVSVENRWGKLGFSILWLVGSAVSAYAYHLWNPGSTVPLVGASGAVAAVMGAFLVLFFRSKITCFYWFFFVFAGRFKIPAFVALPIWFALELWRASGEGAGGGVAYSAHVGGFAVGFVLAAGLRLSNLEQRLFFDRVADHDEIAVSTDIGRAEELLRMGARPDAVIMLTKFIAKEPRHLRARELLLEAALLGRVAVDALEHAPYVFPKLVDQGHLQDAIDLYTRLLHTMPGLVLDERSLCAVAKAAGWLGKVDLATRTTQQLFKSYPQSSLTPGAIWRIAFLQKDRGESEAAAATLSGLVQAYPTDPVAELARQHLSGRSVPRPTGPPPSSSDG